jgi:hypothetical protein
MACAICGSGNQTEFPAEVNIHLPDSLRNADEIGVFVFPRLLVCLDCGSSSFIRHQRPNWCIYALLTNRLPDRTASIAGSRSTAACVLKT